MFIFGGDYMKRRNNGLTIPELLVVLVIVGILAIIGIVTVNRTHEKQRQTYNMTQGTLFVETAKIYFEEHKDLLPKTLYASEYVTLDELINDKYFEDYIKDYDKNPFSGASKVKVTKIGKNKYTYTPVLLDQEGQVVVEKPDSPSTITFTYKNITKTSGKYYVSILTQVSYETLQKTNAKVGIDLGLKDLVITSDGKKYSSNKFIKHYSKELAKAQKHLSRKQKGSNSWNRQRIKVARIQEKIHNCRFDKLHKISTDLIRNYDVICCEDLNVKGMQRNHRLAQAISDASWGAFLSMLTYKAVMNDKQVVKIGRYYPSSKTCHCCGWIKEDLQLKDREWTCPSCGEVLDRDINAAMNILSEGLRNISAGTVDYTDGADIRPFQGPSAMKSEAHKSLVCG